MLPVEGIPASAGPPAAAEEILSEILQRAVRRQNPAAPHSVPCLVAAIPLAETTPPGITGRRCFQRKEGEDVKRSSCRYYAAKRKSFAPPPYNQDDVKFSDTRAIPSRSFLAEGRLDLSSEVALPDAVVADGDAFHIKSVDQIPQNHDAGDQGMDTLRLVAQNQVRRVLVTLT